MEEREQKLKELVLLPGLKELQQRLSIAEEEKRPTGSLMTPKGLLEINDFKVLLAAFLTLIKEPKLKARLLEEFDLDDLDFIKLLINALTKPLSAQEKNLAKNMPSPEELKALMRAYEEDKKIKEAIRKETEAKMTALREELRKALANQEEKLQIALSSELSRRQPELGVSPTQARVLTTETTKAIKSWVSEIPTPLPTTALPERVSRLFLEFSVSREKAERVAADLFKPKQELSGIVKMMEERIRSGWGRLSLTHRQQEMGLLLASSLPKEIIENKLVFKQITENLAQKVFTERGVFGAEVKEEVKKVASDLAGRINTQVFQTTLSPCSFFQPEMPILLKTSETKGAQTKLGETMIKVLEEVEELKDKKLPIEKVASQIIDVASKEEVFNPILVKEAEEQKQAVFQLFQSVFGQEDVVLPAEKSKAIVEKIVNKALPDLVRFLSLQQQAIERLKEGLEKIDQSPTWGVAKVVGAFSEEGEAGLLTGFFTNREERKLLEPLKDHYRGLVVKEQEKLQFENEIFGKTERGEQLENRVAALQRTSEVIKNLAKTTKRPTLVSRSFVFVGRVLRKISSAFTKRVFKPLSIFAQIKNLDLGRFRIPHSTSFTTNLDKMMAGFLNQRFPQLFVRNPANVPVFKFSFPGIKIGVSDFFRGLKSFFRERIVGSQIIQGFLNSSFFQGIKAFGGRFLAKIGGLKVLARAGLMRLGGAIFGGPVGLAISAGVEKLIDLGLGFLNRLLGREEGGSGAEVAGMAILRTGSVEFLLVVLLIVVFFFIYILPLFLMAQRGTAHTALPHLLGK